MTYNQYWHKEPELFWAYRSAYEQKQDVEFEIENYKAWLNGLYNCKAFEVVYYNFNRKEGATPMSYLEKPFDFKEMAKKSKEEIRLEKQKKLETDVKAMLNRGKNILKNSKK